jgi:2-polyprenyl-3-methyl-5-hydroxy-6-metoxy-1,4-benzoquinol methylase
MAAKGSGSAAIRSLYESKNDSYFAGARVDYVSELPANPDASILEIGCGNGNTGTLALAKGKCGRYCGVEVNTTATELAATKITEVVLGDVEQIALPWPNGSFDALILSEVLEHLVDPWAVLKKLRVLMKTGAKVFASSPNVSHYSVILMLMRGTWPLADRGIMDHTHLRWFTPDTFREMFESCGYHVCGLRSVVPLGPRANLAVRLIGKRFEYLFWRQMDLRAIC